jgi:hypothetical protein
MNGDCAISLLSRSEEKLSREQRKKELSERSERRKKVINDIARQQRA